jgi:hypothetical protein
MFPHPPAVVKCHGCGECYWLVDAKEVATFMPGGQVDPAWTAAEEATEPTEEEYYQALQAGLAGNADQERTLRILAWWRRNDAFRGIPMDDPTGLSQTQQARTRAIWPNWSRRNADFIDIPQPVSGPCRENLEALGRRLDEENDKNRLMKGELLRELGDFDAAKLALSSVTTSKYAEAASYLSALCDARDPGVKLLGSARPNWAWGLT